MKLKENSEDTDKIFKSNKDKKYFISTKDLALAVSLVTDGFSLPSNFNYGELSKKFEVPNNLLIN